MTTIVFDGVSVSSDRQITGNFIVSNHGFDKLRLIHTPSGPVIAGCAGAISSGILFFEMLECGIDHGFIGEEFQGIYFDLIRRTCWVVECNIEDKFPVAGPFAIGSGSPYALGAVAAGSSTKEAVMIATKFDYGSGGGVLSFDGIFSDDFVKACLDDWTAKVVSNVSPQESVKKERKKKVPKEPELLVGSTKVKKFR
jgi:hypothetical protein